MKRKVIFGVACCIAAVAPADVVEDVQLPCCIVQTSHGTTLFDFGKDAFGGVEVCFEKGEYEVRIGEKLDSGGGVDLRPGGTIRAAAVGGGWRGKGV